MLDILIKNARVADGTGRAISIVHRLAQDAIDRRKTVLECALASHELGLVLERSTIEPIFDPTAFLGSAGELVDRVLATRRKVCAIRTGRRP